MLVVSMGDGAGIGGGYQGSGSCSNIIIDSCSVIASSKYGAGIGGSKQHAGSNITINSSSVTASLRMVPELVAAKEILAKILPSIVVL